MNDQLSGTIHPMQIPFTVSPSGGGLSVFAMEERFNAYVILVGYTPSLMADERRECVALLTVRGVLQVIYGCPNEEAYWQDPRGKLDHGVNEIVGSQWLESINSYNRASFGTELIASDTPVRHFFVGSKDVSAQFLAREIDVDLFVDQTVSVAYKNARTEALSRLDAYPEP